MQWNNRYRHIRGTIADASCDEIRYVIAVAPIASTHDDVSLRARSHMAGYCSGKSVKFYRRDIWFETWPRLPVKLTEVFHCFPQSFQAILRSYLSPLGHGRFLPRPFHFIIYQPLSQHTIQSKVPTDCKREHDYGKKWALWRHDRRRQGSSVITFIKLRKRRQIGVPFEDYSFSSSPVSRTALDPQS